MKEVGVPQTMVREMVPPLPTTRTVLHGTSSTDRVGTERDVPAKMLGTSPAEITISHRRLRKAEGTSALLPQQISLSPAGI